MLPFCGFITQRAALFRNGVFHYSVDLSAFMVFGQILGDRQTFLVCKKQSMTVLVYLHVIAGTNPSPVFNFFVLVRIETARTQRPPQLIDILG